MKRFLTYAALLACSAVHAGTGSLDALRAAFVRASTASYAMLEMEPYRLPKNMKIFTAL